MHSKNQVTLQLPEKVKILGISGSPRKSGNSEILLRRALDGARELGADVELLRVADKQINACNGCEACRDTGKCPIDDDMQAIYGKLLEANGIIFATPVYFWGMTGQLKSFIDRTYALAFPEIRLRGKVGGVIVVAGRTAVTLTSVPLYLYFSANHMLAGDYVHGFADQKGGIKKDKHAMKAALELGKQVVSLIRKGFEFPGEYDVPIYRYVARKYDIPISIVDQT